MTDDETIVLRGSGLTRDIRFGAYNGLKSDISPCPRSAMNGLMHRNKFDAVSR